MALYIIDSPTPVVDLVKEIELNEPVTISGVIKQTMFQSFEAYSESILQADDMLGQISNILDEYADCNDSSFAIEQIIEIMKNY